MDVVFRSLGAGAATAALLTLAWGTVKGGGKLMWAVFGRRRAQARLLDQLACGSSVDYVESLFGVAQFITFEDEREQRTYHLPGAWVMVELNKRAVIAYSITITSRRMSYSIKRLTFGLQKVKLGKDKFGDHGIGYRGERLWIGAHRFGYTRCYYYGNPAGYQYYWLSYNMSGVGVLSASEATPGLIERGVFAAQLSSPDSITDGDGVDASGITVNTLTVLHPEGPVDQFNSRHILGPDEARVRLASTIRPPSDMSLRTRLRNRRFRMRLSAKRALERIMPK
jgi:hypothetical protein